MKEKTLTEGVARFLAVLFAGLFLAAVAGREPAFSAGEEEIPGDFAMKDTGDDAPVIYSHKKHSEKQKLDCNACHTKVFKLKIGKTAEKMGKLTMKAMIEEGKFCGACHNGDKAFPVKGKENCARCHVKK